MRVALGCLLSIHSPGSARRVKGHSPPFHQPVEPWQTQRLHDKVQQSHLLHAAHHAWLLELQRLHSTEHTFEELFYIIIYSSHLFLYLCALKELVFVH